MAVVTEGGSTGIINQKKTPIAVQKKAFSETEDQAMSKTLLATNYAQKPTLLSSGVSVADWYRDGSAPLQGLSATADPNAPQITIITPTIITPERASKAIEPIIDDVAAFQVFGTAPTSAKAPTTGKNTNKKGDVELVPKFTKFILESMSEGHAERSQISETFGSFYVFFFGERPPVYSYAGTLINARDINWRADFQFYYDNYLRGSKCVERNARIVMTYGGRQVEGFMLNFQTTTDAAVEMGVKVTFQMLITDRQSVLGLSQDFGVFSQNGANFRDDTFTKMLNDIAGKEGKGLSSQATSVAYNEAKKALAGSPANTHVLNSLSKGGSGSF